MTLRTPEKVVNENTTYSECRFTSLKCVISRDAEIAKELRERFKNKSFIVPNPEAPTGSLVVISKDDYDKMIEELEGQRGDTK